MNIDDILLSEFQKLSESCKTEEQYTRFIERWIIIWNQIYEKNYKNINENITLLDKISALDEN
tara:strand:- start:484 stop:672 length:189 start_codon:yes stop_codon:yes gene_type:complete